MINEIFQTFKVKLVGCNFANPSRVPEAGDVIKIKLEPNNKYDKDAIMVLNHNGEKIGYIGNKRNGCIDNVTLKSLVDFENNQDYLGIITKFKGYFGFIDITVVKDD